MIQPTTPYMLRKDGELLPCGNIHPYLTCFEYDDEQAFDELEDNDLQWYFDNTKQDEVKNLIKNIRQKGSLEDFKKLIQLTNNEFCKVRTSNHKYKYGGDNGEIYFRLCNDDNFNWYDVIWKTVLAEKDYVKNVTIMRDAQTFGNQFDYCIIKNNLVKHIPVDEFLTMSGNPVIEAYSDKIIIKDDEKKVRSVVSSIIKSIENRFRRISLHDSRPVTASIYVSTLAEQIGQSIEAACHPYDISEKELHTFILYAMLEMAKDNGDRFFVYRRNKHYSGAGIDYVIIDTRLLPKLSPSALSKSNKIEDAVLINYYNNVRELMNISIDIDDFEYIDPNKYLQ